MTIAVIVTENVISASGVLDGKPIFVSVPKVNPLYKKMINAYKNKEYDTVLALGNIAKSVELLSDKKFYITDGIVYDDSDTPMPKSLSTRIIAFAKEGLPYDALVTFWNKLKNHVSEKVRNELYGFLEHNNIPITLDGCFVCYKKVTRGRDGNLWDSRTFNDSTGVGTFRNNLGDSPEMPRDQVDSDSSVTCSTGLHAAAFDYAASFSGDTLIHTKIDPLDVVSIPTDYNNMKMRVCKYEVVAVGETEKITTQIYDYDDTDEDEPDYENETLLNNKPIPIILKTRKDGRLEIPMQYIFTLNCDFVCIFGPCPAYPDSICIVPSTSTDPLARSTIRHEFRFSPAQYYDEQQLFSEYVLEVSPNQLTITPA